MPALTPNRFPALVAYDSNTGNTVKNAQADVYATTDTSYTTPLPLTDLNGVSMAKLVSSNDGVFPPFVIDSVTEYSEVVAKSGSFVTPMVSFVGGSGPQGPEGPAGIGVPDPDGVPEGYVLTLKDGEWSGEPPTGGGGRELEIRASSTHIQRRYVGDAAWTDIIALSELRGAAGTNGTNGTNGSNGESIQIRVSGDYFQAKYPSQTLWTNVAPYTPAGSVLYQAWNGVAWGDRPTARTDVIVIWVGGPAESVPSAAVGADIHWPDAE